MHKSENSSFLTFENYELKTPQGKCLKSGLSFDLSPGDYLCLKGENGAGKTTLAKLITAELQARKIQVEYLPQLSSLTSTLPLTLGEVILMTEVGVSQIPDSFISPEALGRAWNLASGGERKKALLARALLKRPSVLILDEPFNHLDIESVREIENWLLNLIRSGQVKAVVMASHQESPLHAQLEGVILKEVKL